MTTKDTQYPCALIPLATACGITAAMLLVLVIGPRAKDYLARRIRGGRQR